MSDHGAQLRWKVQLEVNPNPPCQSFMIANLHIIIIIRKGGGGGGFLCGAEDYETQIKFETYFINIKLSDDFVE